jgi:hypothetical protein
MPPPSPSASAHHLRLWWRRRGRAGAVGATFAVAFLAAALLLMLSYYASAPPATSSVSPGRSPALVGLTLVRGAEEKGAREFPLPNSPATFFFLSFYSPLHSTSQPIIHASVFFPRAAFNESSWVLVFTVILAVCLDGSAPGYHLQRGYEGGSQSWLIHLEVSHK